MEDIKEKDLYEPVMKALKKNFSEFDCCYFEITANNINNEIKRYLDDL